MQGLAEKAKQDAMWLEQQLQLREAEAAEQRAMLSQLQRGQESLQAENVSSIRQKDAEIAGLEA
jgi:hypothetical protein